MKMNYNHTMYACFVGYMVQAIVNNFVNLLFLTFQNTYGIPMTKITFLITFNFGMQLFIDAIAPKFVDRIGYKVSAVIAHVAAAIGLMSLAFLPEMFSEPFVGLLLSVVIYAVGGGLLEVLISPIVEACPSDNKEAAMSLLHSFYCWGHVMVVVVSTIFFAVFGIENWKIMACIWALIPLANAVFFTQVPIASLIEEGETGLTIKQLLSKGLFWLMVLLMVCAGASEQAVSQWASTFAEQGLGVSKTVGDLAGPMLFAISMGLARTIYGKFGDKLDLQKFILGSGMLCVASYLLIALSPWPILGFLGCGLCGFSVGIMWPGVFSMASAQIRNGGTIMFAYLALAGDLGCGSGPTIVGAIAGLAGNNIKVGVLAAIIFPVLLIGGIGLNKIRNKRQGEGEIAC